MVAVEAMIIVSVSRRNVIMSAIHVDMLIVDQMRTVLCLSLQEKSTVLLAVPKATHVALIDAYWSLCLALFHPALIQDCASRIVL